MSSGKCKDRWPNGMRCKFDAAYECNKCGMTLCPQHKANHTHEKEVKAKEVRQDVILTSPLKTGVMDPRLRF